MARIEPLELKDWDEIYDLAGTGNPRSNPSKAQAMIAHKLVLSIVNLQETITSHQAKTAGRLDELTKSINTFNTNSGRLAKAGLWLSSAIALAAVASVVVLLIMPRYV